MKIDFELEPLQNTVLTKKVLHDTLLFVTLKPGHHLGGGKRHHYFEHEHNKNGCPSDVPNTVLTKKYSMIHFYS